MIKAFGRQEYTQKIQWIAPVASDSVRGCVFRARRKVRSEEIASNRILHIAAESYYVLYVNGVQVGSGPARGTENCNFLDTWDITDYVVYGQNCIAVEVFCNNFATFMAAPAQPAMFVASGSLLSDSDWQVQLAGEYRIGDVPHYTPQTGLMEWRDLRKTPKGWQTFSDDSIWAKAEIITPEHRIYHKNLFLRDIPQLTCTEIYPADVPVVKAVKRPKDTNDPNVASLMESEEHVAMHLCVSSLLNQEPQDIAPPPKNGGVVLIIDFGCEFIGHFQMDVDAPSGTIMDVGYQEVISKERLNVSIAEYRFADRYILTEGRQSFGNPLRWRGGRYIQLVFREFSRPITIHALKIMDMRYPIKDASQFNCDNSFYNELWKCSLSTLSACATDTIIDCPWREMSFWINDFLVVNRYWLQMTGQGDLSRRCLSLALSQRREDGLIPGVCPYDGNPKVVLFATQMFLPLILHDYLAYTGDRNYVEQVLDEISDIVDMCTKFSDSNGLLVPPREYWNFVDWSYELNGITLNGRNSCVVNWFFVLALDTLGDLYRLANISKSDKYYARAGLIAGQIEKLFWNPKQECFIEYLIDHDDNQPPLAGKLAHALALLSGRMPQEKINALIRAIFREDLLTPELYMMHFLFEAIVKIDRPQEAERLIIKYWKPILDSGCQTIWEMGVHQQGKSAINNYGSLCHAFSLAPVNFLQRHILGLIPSKEGFPKFTFNPQLGKLSWLKGSLETPKGTIHVDCQSIPQAIRTNLKIPPGIIIDDAENDRIRICVND